MSNLVKVSSAIEKAKISNGNVEQLTEIERKLVYNELCKAYKLDPLSFPLDYVKSKQGLKIYLNAVGAAQLRDRYQISTQIKSREFLEDMWVVVVVANRGDRTEEATGAVSTKDKYGNSTPEDKVNIVKNDFFGIIYKAEKQLNEDLKCWFPVQEVRSRFVSQITNNPYLLEEWEEEGKMRYRSEQSKNGVRSAVHQFKFEFERALKIAEEEELNKTPDRPHPLDPDYF